MRVRLALWGLVLLGIAQVVVSSVLYVAISTWLEDQVNSNLLLTATQVSSVMYSADDPQSPLDVADTQLQFAGSTTIATQGFLNEQLFFVRLIDRTDGTVQAATADYGIPVFTGSGDESYFETVTFDHLNQPHEMRLYTLTLSYAPSYALQVGISLTQTRAIQQDMRSLLVVLLGFTGMLAVLSGWFLANRALVPIRAIGRTAAEINETDLSRRLDLSGTEIELEQLVETFNEMLRRIESAFQRQRQFTADAAHELRTPLSIMQTGLEVILSQPRSIAEYQTTLASVQEEVERLSQLAHMLLVLARTDSGEIPPNMVEFDLSLMLRTVIEQFAPAAAETGIHLMQDIAPDLLLQGNEDRLIQAVYNLIHNAIKFTPSDGMVSISAKATPEQVTITVADTGPGIPPEDLPHIFDRFYRVDSARQRGQGGFGLGLAIAKRLIALHGGTITAHSVPGEGTQFVVTLPLRKRQTGNHI